MPKCDFNKVALQLYWNRTSVWVSPVNLVHTFRTPSLWTPQDGCFCTGLFTKTGFDVKITEIENKIRDINGFITSYEINSLAKVVLDENLKNVTKYPATKGNIATSLHLGEENKNKIDNLIYLLGNSKLHDFLSSAYKPDFVWLGSKKSVG